MRYQYIPYIWPLMLSAFVPLSLGIYAYIRHRNAKGAKSFIASMLVVTVWSGANALEMSGSDLQTKLFWANMQYFAYCYSPVTLLALCMQFTGFERYVNAKNILRAAVLPTITILLVWTDGLHGLVRYNMHLEYGGSFPVIAKEYGPYFFVHSAYSHFLNITSLVLLIKTIFSENLIYIRQALSLFIGVSMIVVPNIMYILGLGPAERFDITPVFFGPAGLIIALGIFRFRMFDLVPLARATVIETMNTGVLVLDAQNRVLDINPAFEKILGLSASRTFGRRLPEVCGRVPELLAICDDWDINHMEFSAITGGVHGVFEAFISPLTGSGGIPIGRVVLAYEITEIKQTRQELLEQQRRLAAAEERERMARDMHDNLGQELGFVNLQAQAIRKELLDKGVNSISDKLDRLVNVTQSAHSDIRKYIKDLKDLRNGASVEGNFIDELKKDISQFEKQSGVNAELYIPDGFTGRELEPDIRTNVLGIVKEALNNARKHAETSNVTVSFLLARDELRVVVKDDGKGFNARENENGAENTYGLRIMRERASEIGARLNIESSEGMGSRIELRIPVLGAAK
jgi:PAS domain S-box-containing protein